MYRIFWPTLIFAIANLDSTAAIIRGNLIMQPFKRTIFVNNNGGYFNIGTSGDSISFKLTVRQGWSGIINPTYSMKVKFEPFSNDNDTKISFKVNCKSDSLNDSIMIEYGGTIRPNQSSHNYISSIDTSIEFNSHAYFTAVPDSIKINPVSDSIMLEKFICTIITDTIVPLTNINSPLNKPDFKLNNTSINVKQLSISKSNEKDPNFNSTFLLLNGKKISNSFVSGFYIIKGKIK